MGENNACTVASRQIDFNGVEAAATLYAANEALLNECLAKPAVCVIGAFDGVHVGHRLLLERGLKEAGQRNATCIVVMFDPDPAKVVCSSDQALDLMSPATRRQVIQAQAGAPVLVFKFTKHLAGLTYDAFVSKVLRQAFDLRCICVGSNFRLGAKGAGDVAALTQMGQDLGFDVMAVDLACTGGLPVSATRIRGLLCDGKVQDAAELLGRPHTVFGQVIHGRGQGTSFGFPTANVAVDASLIMPREGVYAGFVSLYDATAQKVLSYPAAINVGSPQSFTWHFNDAQFLEATLLGFSSSIYDARVAVSFTDFLRDPKNFASLEELEACVLGNIDQVKRALGTTARDGEDLLGGAGLDN